MPSGAESARFDIKATSRETATPADLAMVRSLLAERFQLVTRRDTRQMDIYTLVQMSPGSSKLKPSEADCQTAANAPLTPPADDKRPRCQILPMTGRGRVNATGARLSNLTNILTNVVGRQVVDKTGLTGPFNLNLTWTPDPGMQARPAGVPVEMRVIERLEPPSPD